MSPPLNLHWLASWNSGTRNLTSEAHGNPLRVFHVTEWRSLCLFATARNTFEHSWTSFIQCFSASFFNTPCSLLNRSVWIFTVQVHLLVSPVLHNTTELMSLRYSYGMHSVTWCHLIVMCWSCRHWQLFILFIWMNVKKPGGTKSPPKSLS